MLVKVAWAILAAVWFTLIVKSHGPMAPTAFQPGAEDVGLYPWVYGSAYLLFGVLLLGAISRWQPATDPVFWRPTMLIVGGLLAVVDLALQQASNYFPIGVERWMVALLGLTVAAIAARLLPPWALYYWLGTDRRRHGGAERKQPF